MKLKPLALSILLASASLSLPVLAADPYNPTQHYSAGAEVELDGFIYRAKWWVNAGQYPNEVVENPWDTPWELVGPADEDGENPQPPVNPDPPTKPEPPVNPQPPSDGRYPEFVAGTTYNSGDIVEADGQFYKCRAGVSLWCSSPSPVYFPGTGSAWQSAWELVDEDGNSLAPEDIVFMTKKQLADKEKELTRDPKIQDVLESVRVLDNATVEAVTPGAATNPANVKRVEAIMSSADWEFLFPQRAKEYTYRGFLQSVAKFPAFCEDYTDGRDADAICRRSMATMFAHFAQETGGHDIHSEIPEWRQALVHVREMGWHEGMKHGYNSECNPDLWQGQTWPCGVDKDGDFLSYFGRGAKQLSYSYNYGPFSQKMFGDVRPLLDHPELVADTWLNLSSALFFFMQPQTPKPSMQDVINGTWQPNALDLSSGLVPGFGVTTQIINGGVECGGSVEVAQSLNRIAYFKEMAKHFNVHIPADEVLGCAGMKQFDAGGAGAVNTYWEKDWSYNPDMPNNESYACKLVAYQTPHSVLIEGDYEKCVVYHFPDVVIIDEE